MNGFCMQKTDFPFVAIIIDDASTDGEPDVIRNYLEAHFDMDNAQYDENNDAKTTFAIHNTNVNCHFLVIFLKYNFYSIKKDKRPLFNSWCENVPYVALCEGDDYWTDPTKLQKQVNFLDNHPECLMVCNRTKQYSESKKDFIRDCLCANKDQYLYAKDVVKRGGLFISTCSIVIRQKIYANYPDYCRRCHVGDYPLQITAAMKGKIYFFNAVMSVYRVENSSSWVCSQNDKKNYEKRVNGVLSDVNMLNGFAKDYPTFRRIFKQRIAWFVNNEIVKWQAYPETKDKVRTFFSTVTSDYSWFWKLDLWMSVHLKGQMKKVYSAVVRRLFDLC